MFAIDKLLNLIRSEATAVLSTFTQTRIGIVSNYDPDTYTAQVLIQPDEIQTGWLPILSEWVGNNWGMYVPPTIGDTVIIHFQEGDLTTGFVGQKIFNKNQLALNTPNGPPSGEFWLVHKTGTFLKFHNDGTLEIKTLDGNGDPTNINITSNVVITGNLTMQGTGKGNITATGDILDKSATNTNNMRLMRSIYDTHTHNDPQGGVTGVPNQPM